MFGLSLSHLLVLLVVILLFGSRRLPELGSSLGRTINAFKKGLEGDDENEKKRIADGSSSKDDGHSGNKA